MIPQLQTIILQYCDPNMGLLEYMQEFDFWRAFVCPYANTMGFLTFGLIVYGTISISLYLVTGSLVIPVVLLLTIGPVILGQIAAPGIPIAVLALLGAGSGAVTLLLFRYNP